MHATSGTSSLRVCHVADWGGSKEQAVHQQIGQGEENRSADWAGEVDWNGTQWNMGLNL